MKIQICFILFTVIANPVFAQKETMLWYTNYGLKFDFSSDSIKITKGSVIDSSRKDLNTINANTICDKNGNLLFYTNSETIWNKENRVMENGDSIKIGRCSGFRYQRTSVIIPFSSDSTKYYLVTGNGNQWVSVCYNNDPPRADSLLYYHIIDMSFNNGNGKVVNKNIPFTRYSTLNFATVKHRNGIDTWLINNISNQSSFESHLFTPCGVKKISENKIFGFFNNEVSRLTFSPDGKYAMCVGYADSAAYSNISTLEINPNYLIPSFDLSKRGIFIYKFDDSTGKLTNHKFIFYSELGIAFENAFTFSLDSKSIILNYQIQRQPIISKIVQIFFEKDKKDNSYEKTLAYHNNLSNCLTPIYGGRIMGLWRGYGDTLCKMKTFVPDSNKPQNYRLESSQFYLLKRPIKLDVSVQFYVSTFFKPDYKTPEPYRLFPSISGPARVCFRDTATFLGAVRDPKIDSLTWKVYRKDTLVLTSKGTRLSRVFPPGDYHITLTAWRTCVQQSINQNLEVAPDPQININLASKDTLFTCKNSPLVLDAGPRLSYQWQNGSTTQTISATQEGKYTVKGSNACGSASDSVWVSYFQPKIPNIFTPNQDQKNDVFSITPYPNQGGSLKIQDRWGREVYQNQNYANDWSADGLPDGIYYYHFQFSTCEPKAGWVQVVR